MSQNNQNQEQNRQNQQNQQNQEQKRNQTGGANMPPRFSYSLPGVRRFSIHTEPGSSASPLPRI